MQKQIEQMLPNFVSCSPKISPKFQRIVVILDKMLMLSRQ